MEYCIRIRVLLDDLFQRDLITGSYRNGETSTQAVLAGTDALIDHDLKPLDTEDLRLGKTFQTADQWSAIVANWDYLKNNESTLQPNDSLNMTNELIDDLLALNTQVANASHLTMDTNLDSYYLIDTALNKLPFELEKTAQLTIAGVDMATSESTDTSTKIQLAQTSGALKSSLDSLQNGLQVVYQQNPGLKPQLNAAGQGQINSTMQFLDTVNTDLVGASTVTVQPSDIYDIGLASLSAGFQLYDTSLSTLDGMLRQRIDSLARPPAAGDLLPPVHAGADLLSLAGLLPLIHPHHQAAQIGLCPDQPGRSDPSA